MLRIAALVLLITSALGQEAPAPIRVSPDDAAKHLIKSNPPEYPPLAQAARIQGNVILEIGIDETGAASVRRLVSGHPMLVAAAVRAVSGWKYEPFVVDGKPTRAVTFVSVWFGGSANDGAASGQAEALLENAFWSAVEEAQTALVKGDYAGSEEQMMKAKEAVPPERPDLHHVTEQWQWMTTMGRLRMAQQEYDDAEQYYRKALALREGKSEDKDAPELAASLANLGNLYVEAKKLDLAHENFVRSESIYQKNFKRVEAGNPGARQAYGRAIAYQSWALFRLAKQRNDTGDAEAQCRSLLDYQEFLRPADHDSYVAACQLKIPAPAKP